MSRRDSGAIQMDLDYHAQRRAGMAAQPAEVATPVEATLFPPEVGVVGEGNNAPVEHDGLPQPKRREDQPPTLILSLETEADRAALAALLGGRVDRRGREWECWWPPGTEENDAALRFDLGDAT